MLGVIRDVYYPQHPGCPQEQRCRSVMTSQGTAGHSPAAAFPPSRDMVQPLKTTLASQTLCEGATTPNLLHSKGTHHHILSLPGS